MRCRRGHGSGSTLAARAGDARPRLPRVTRSFPVTRRLLAIACLVALAGCGTGSPPATPPIIPGTSAAPREVNIIAKDWVFLPDRVDVVPGETVLLHVINGGLDVHEAVIGDAAVQDAWDAGEAATTGSPPGPSRGRPARGSSSAATSPVTGPRGWSSRSISSGRSLSRVPTAEHAAVVRFWSAPEPGPVGRGEESK